MAVGGPQWLVPNCLALLGLPPGLAAPAWVGPRFLVGTISRPFYHRILVKNGADAYGASGLPKGLSLDRRTGLITGQPSQAGTFEILFSATNRLGSTQWTVTLFVNGFAAAPVMARSTSTSSASLGLGFSYAVVAHNSPEWYGASGLPAGLAIDPHTGVISGAPTEVGEFVVNLVATNHFGEGTGLLTLEISPVVAWGDTNLDQTTLPTGLSNVVAIASGGPNNLALTAQGRIVAWGA